MKRGEKELMGKREEKVMPELSGLTTASGTGCLAKIGFVVIGEEGDESVLNVCVVGDLPRISGMSKFVERELGMEVELAFATSSALNDFEVSCTKFVSSYDKFIEEIKGLDIKVLFGTDEERRLRNNTIVFTFPSFTRMSYVPYLGKGTLNLIADIYERLMGCV